MASAFEKRGASAFEIKQVEIYPDFFVDFGQKEEEKGVVLLDVGCDFVVELGWKEAGPIARKQIERVRDLLKREEKRLEDMFEYSNKVESAFLEYTGVAEEEPIAIR